MGKRRLLLLSNGSELIGQNPSAFAQSVLRDFLGQSVRRVLFVPFATVERSTGQLLSGSSHGCAVWEIVMIARARDFAD